MCQNKLFHDWDFWGPVIDTSNGIYKAQFTLCKRCQAVKHRYIRLYTSVSAAVTTAEVINENLPIGE